MATYENLIRGMVDCYSSMSADELAPILHPQAKHTAPGSDFGADLEGKEKIVEYFKSNVFPSFEKVRFEIVNYYEDSGKSVAIVEWRSHLWPKTGKEYQNTGVFVIEVRDGKVYWVREYFDTEKSHQNV